MSYLASKSIISGILYNPLEILENKSFSLVPLNGCYPVSIINIITPKDHISAANPQYSFL